MEMHEIIAFILSIVMGITLGVFGGGGSILTLPILVYVLHIDPVLGTAYSLFVVGFTALVGAISKLKNKEIDLKVAATFAIPSILAVYATRRYILPAIPNEFGQIGSLVIDKDLGLMLLFALVMLLASYSMIRKSKPRSSDVVKPNYLMIVVDGLLVGTLTGLIGAGGGFLIVPALVVIVGLEIKKAVATSLLIISLKSLIGFTGDIGSGQAIDWKFLILFTALAVIGMLAGLLIGKRIESAKLKTAFGWFILAMAVMIIMMELFG